MKSPGESPALGCALIVLLTIVAYLPALHGGFIWDDDDHLTRNPAMQSVDGLRQIWSTLEVSRYYPLTLTSFWVQRRLWGLEPLPYHAVNIALEAVNAVLVCTLLRRLGVRGAWVAAVLWAVHPVNVETVAWVTELKNTQSALFFLLALLMFLRFEEELRPRDYGMVLACGVAAMLSKPSTVMLPGVMLLCTWWRRGRWTRRDILRVAPLAVFAVGMSLLTIVEQRRHIEHSGPSAWALTAGQRLVLAGRAVWFYTGKLFCPTNLCFIYPRWELRPQAVAAWLPLAAVVLVAAVLWHFRRAGWARATTFGVAYFILVLLPVLGFFDIYFFQYSFVADHFQYLAGIGLIAVAVSAATTISQRAGQRGRASEMLAVAIVLLMLTVCTWRQTLVYHDLETLWRDTLAKNPNAWIAHNNLGSVLAGQGKISEEIAEYKASLQINPDNVEALRNLGATYVQLGRVQEAIDPWERVVQLRPDYAEAHYNLGVALEQVGRRPEAMAHWEQALRLQPDMAEAHYNLGVALAGLGRIQEAIDHWQQALRINPDYAEAHYNLGVALEQAGRVPEAIGHYEQAVRIRPEYTEAQDRLARFRARQ